MRLLFFAGSMIFLLVTFQACLRSENEYSWHLLSRGNGKWNVDLMRIITIHSGSGQVTSTEELKDIGKFYFEGSKDKAVLRFEESIKVHPDYNVYYGPLQSDVAAQGTILEIEDGESGEGALYYVTYQSNRSVNFHVPSQTNSLIAGPYDFSFEFECSKD